MMKTRAIRALSGLTVLGLVAVAGSSANAQVVFQNSNNNGWINAFGSSTSSSVRYGDSGWLSNFTSDTYTLTRITLGMTMSGSSRLGSTKLNFSLHNGDPSGLIYGNGATLYSTQINFVELPDASETGGLSRFDVVIDLPGVSTLGGFNNIGWSVGVENFDSDGMLGFQCGTAFDQITGFYTNNASFYDGSAWSLFSFGPDFNTGVANFTTRIEIPAPGSAALMGAMGLVAGRRRRTA